MTTADCITPKQVTATKPEHIVTRNTAGELCCTCQRFKVNAVMYGAAECDHTRAVELAAQAREQ
jgi:predicted nucleic acid-binding Zn finger protein